MSVAKYIFTAVRFWKILLKWIFDRTKWYEITVDELFERINSDQPPLLIDVRFAQEFNGGYGHIPNARSIPVLDLKSNIEDLEPFKEKEIVTMCPGGGMSLVAVDILTEAGFKKVKSLNGGTDLWHQKGYPMTRD